MQEGAQKGGDAAHSFLHWIYLIGACKNSLTEANCACCWIMDHSEEGLPGTGAGTTVPCWTHRFLCLFLPLGKKSATNPAPLPLSPLFLFISIRLHLSLHSSLFVGVRRFLTVSCWNKKMCVNENKKLFFFFKCQLWQWYSDLLNWV